METKLCECGCCNIVKIGNRFIVGHNQRGKSISEDHKTILKNYNLNSWKDPIKRKKRISNIKKTKNTEEGKKKIIRAGKLGGDSVKRKCLEDPNFLINKIESGRIGGIKSWSDPDNKKHLLEVRKTQWTPQARKNMSNSTIKRFENPEEREKDRQQTLKRFQQPGAREQQSKVIAQAHIDGKLNNNGRFKTGYIQTETCGEVFYQSSYEERFIKILEFFFKGKWKRCNQKFKYFDGEVFKFYVPDYIYLEELFFEVKGWFSEKDRIKVLDSINRNKISVCLIFEKDLKMLENLISKGIKKFPFEKIEIIKP